MTSSKAARGTTTSTANPATTGSSATPATTDSSAAARPPGGYDTLTGGADDDRFLTMSGAEARLIDRSARDARINFKDHTFDAFGAGTFWNKVAWTQGDVALVDVGLRDIHNKTQNTVLLKLANGGEQDFYRVGYGRWYVPGGGICAGWNQDNFGITITQNSFNGGPGEVAATVVHEIAHNWDSSSELNALFTNGSQQWQKWLNLSGWSGNIPVWHDAFNPVGKDKSTDGNWWHNETAPFARDYGKTNPLEDWATSWEIEFYGTATEKGRMAGKLNELDGFFEAARNKQP